MKRLFVPLCVCFCICFILKKQCLAEDVGITLNTTLSSSYSGTVSLSSEIKKRLGTCVKSSEKAEISKALKKLNDGDILVISVHSNPSVFAIGQGSYHWGLFWKYFEIEKPPCLAMVIIGGCMARSFKYQGEIIYVDITDPEVDFILRNFGAKAMFLPSTTINPFYSNTAIDGILERAIDENRRLAKCVTNKKWRYVTAPGINRIAVTLKDLRIQARGQASQGNLSTPERKSLPSETHKSVPSKYKSLEWSTGK